METKIHSIGATLVGVDGFGNKYYEKLENTQFRRHRWVEYADKKHYNASVAPPEWHGWLHYIIDRTPEQLQMLKPKRFWKLPFSFKYWRQSSLVSCIMSSWLSTFVHPCSFLNPLSLDRDQEHEMSWDEVCWISIVVSWWAGIAGPCFSDLRERMHTLDGMWFSMISIWTKWEPIAS